MCLLLVISDLSPLLFFIFGKGYLTTNELNYPYSYSSNVILYIRNYARDYASPWYYDWNLSLQFIWLYQDPISYVFPLTPDHSFIPVPQIIQLSETYDYTITPDRTIMPLSPIISLSQCSRPHDHSNHTIIPVTKIMWLLCCFKSRLHHDPNMGYTAWPFYKWRYD